MKSIFSTVILALLTWSAFAQTKIEAKHNKATVFLQGATLNAKSSSTLNSGKNTLLITGLSGGLEKESIRIKSKDAKIGTFTHQLNFLNQEANNKEIQKWVDEKKSIDDQISKLNQQSQILTQEKDMILSNKTVAGQDNGLDPVKLTQLAEFYRNRLNDILNKQLSIQSEKEKLELKSAELSQQISSSSSKNIAPSSEIELQVEIPRSGTYSFEIEYYIKDAGWFPSYDFRVNTLNDPYQIDYLASIYQNSGFDWNQMEMVVSSADPLNNISGIYLTPWYVNNQSSKLSYEVLSPKNSKLNMEGYVFDQNGNAIPYATLRVDESSLGGMSDAFGKYKLQLTPQAKIVHVSALGYQNNTMSAAGGKRNIYLQEEVKHLESVAISKESVKFKSNRNISAAYSDNAPPPPPPSAPEIIESNVNQTKTAVNFEYELKEKVNIKSNGKPLSFFLQSIQTIGAYQSTVIPRVNSNAFLNIYLPEWEKLNLLEGEVNLYYANNYIGKSTIILNDVKDSLRFDFGKDPNLKTVRSLASAKTSNVSLSSNKQSEYKWNTEVRNISNSDIKVKVVEPFPISQNKEIKVDLDKELSGASINNEKGLLTWEITLKPGETRKLNFGYTVTYPKTMNMKFD